MKRQINLYGAEFRPKRQWASLNQMALVWGFALLLMLLVASVTAGNSNRSAGHWYSVMPSWSSSAARRNGSMPSWRAIRQIPDCNSNWSTSRMN